jgi:hypothetical protein
MFHASGNDYACGLDNSPRDDGPDRENAISHASESGNVRGYDFRDRVQHVRGVQNMPYRSS